MSAVSFHDAPPQQDFSELVPAGTLAWAFLKIRPFNMDQGLIETPSKATHGNAYLDIELALDGGDWNKRRIFTNIGVAGSEKYINMGRSAIRAILETGRGAGPQNMAGYTLQTDSQNRPNWMELDGLRVGIKVKVEPGKDGYPDKNAIATWLSPLDPTTQKDFERLCKGDCAPKATATRGTTAPAAAPAPVWQQATAGTQQSATQAQPAATTPAKPGWLATPTAAAHAAPPAGVATPPWQQR